jgi:PAP2 superfamily
MKYYKLLFLFAILIVLQNCKKETEPNPIIPPDPTIPLVPPSSDAAVKWGEMTLKTMTKLAKTTPTYGSRALGYMGLTMYETVVNGSKKHATMALQMTNLPTLPKPTPGLSMNYVIAMNAGQAFMLKNLFEYADAPRIASIDSLEMVILNENKVGLTQTEIDRAVNYGKSVAEAIFEWSKTDGGYQGYNRNFVATYVFPNGDGKWIPPLNGQVVSPYPLHPFWGQNRTFAPTNSQLPVPGMMAFSKISGSEYYEQFNAVYQKNLTLTQSEKEIAAWWGDDPTETFTPPGHSCSLANQVIKVEKPDIFKAAETYARVGTAVADAFVNCWKAKYTYSCERPSTFVNKNIKAGWIQLWPEPPFPAFYSGHSVQGASSATVLEALYGQTYSFTDNSHVGRPKDDLRNIEFKSRKYNSFWEAAEESAMSRFYGGIHTKLDNETGLAEGKKIGGNINKLVWNK